MSKRSTKLLVTCFLSVLIIGYFTSVYFSYQRMSVEHKIYLQIVDTGRSDSVTPIPIPSYIKRLLWDRMGGRTDVLEIQDETGKTFLFVMNLMDDARKNKAFELKLNESLNLAKELFCSNTSEGRINMYQDFADKTNNSSLKAYIDEFRLGNIC